MNSSYKLTVVAQPGPAQLEPLVLTRHDMKGDRLRDSRGGSGLTPSYMRGVDAKLAALANPPKTGGMDRHKNGQPWIRKSLDELVHGY